MKTRNEDINVVEFFGITQRFYEIMNKLVGRNDITTVTDYYKLFMEHAKTENEKIFAGYCLGIIVALYQY